MADSQVFKPFAAKMLNIYTVAVLTKLIDIGYRTGLFESTRAELRTAAAPAASRPTSMT